VNPRHFLTLCDLSPDEFKALVDRAIELKRLQKQGQLYQPIKNRTMAMIFEKSSTRTRISFEAGMTQLGGHAMFLSPRDTQLGRGELIEDSARVLSRIADIIMIRTFEHSKVERFAKYSSVPVINALTDDFHPCQLLADVQTFVERKGSMQGKTVTYIGDGNNMCNSYINASGLLDFQLHIACPVGFEPMKSLTDRHRDRVTIYRDPVEAVRGAHLVTTDVWASMGQEHEQAERAKAFDGFHVSPALMDLADADALFMHCLPAHRGEEISHDMLDDRRSVVWDEAENRLHAQKALIELLLKDKIAL